jgi:hypothetical protein
VWVRDKPVVAILHKIIRSALVRSLFKLLKELLCILLTSCQAVLQAILARSLRLGHLGKPTRVEGARPVVLLRRWVLLSGHKIPLFVLFGRLRLRLLCWFSLGFGLFNFLIFGCLRPFIFLNLCRFLGAAATLFLGGRVLGLADLTWRAVLLLHFK